MTAPSLKLYMIPGSSSLFPHILLRHCNLKFTPIVVQIADLAKDTYIHPNRQVPVLVMDDKDMITENPAIAFAINQLTPDKKLFGEDLRTQIQVAEWLAWVAGPLHAQSWSPYMRPYRFTDSTVPEVLAAIKETARRKCEERYATLEAKLHPVGPWAVGSTFTAVDAYLYCFYQFAVKRLQLDMRNSYPKWSRVVDSLSGLESVQEALRFEEEERRKH